MGVIPNSEALSCGLIRAGGTLVSRVRTDKGGSWGYGPWIGCFVYERNAHEGQKFAIRRDSLVRRETVFLSLVSLTSDGRASRIQKIRK